MSEAKISPTLHSDSEHDEILVHLARLSLSGREQDIATYLQRVARRLRATSPDTAAALTTVLREAPTNTLATGCTSIIRSRNPSTYYTSTAEDTNRNMKTFNASERAIHG